jgi:MFS family permease
MTRVEGEELDVAGPRAAGTTLLAVGVVAIEFSAAVYTFVSSTLLPMVARDLHARDHLGYLLAGSTLGLFVALPLAARVLRGRHSRRALTFGLFGYVVGSVIAATAHVDLVFAAGQFLAGLASGILAVFGISSVIQHFDRALRVRVLAASSAMWIVPALVGPPVTLALAHAFGWRWALLLPVPIVIVGRLLVIRAARADTPDDAPPRPVGRTLLIPLGVAALVLTGGHTALWPVSVLGTLVAGIGVATIMPSGTAALRRGTPAALGAMLLFSTGYFGADSLITVLLTDGYRASLPQAAVVLSSAPLAWAVTSLLLPRLTRAGRRPPAIAGLVMAGFGITALALFPLASTSFVAALCAWTIAGIGIGLAYPGLYIICTSPEGSGGIAAAALAAAVITAESFGGLLGRAGGGAIVSIGAAAGMSRTDCLVTAYVVFAVFLFAAATAASRSSLSRRRSTEVGRPVNS